MIVSLMLGESACGGGNVSTNLTQDDVTQILAAHNEARGSVSPPAATPIPDLTWSDGLAHDAAVWANECTFGHSGNGHGENIYATSGHATGTDAVNDWISESANYDYATNTCASGEVCGHYTQVVWAASLQVGCAKKSCSTGSPFAGQPDWEIWVCDYDPPGNFSGHKPY